MANTYASSRVLLFLSVVVLAIPLFAQQTGSIHGSVTASDGSALPGVTVEASSNVLPQPRVTTTDGNGDYRLPALIPGTYTSRSRCPACRPVTRKAEVLLGQDTAVDVKLGVHRCLRKHHRHGRRRRWSTRSRPRCRAALAARRSSALPLTQNYGDLQKLIPGVMVHPGHRSAVRAPARAGRTTSTCSTA